MVFLPKLYKNVLTVKISKKKGDNPHFKTMYLAIKQFLNLIKKRGQRFTTTPAASIAWMVSDIPESGADNPRDEQPRQAGVVLRHLHHIQG